MAAARIVGAIGDHGADLLVLRHRAGRDWQQGLSPTRLGMIGALAISAVFQYATTDWDKG